MSKRPEMWELVDTGKDYPERFAVRALGHMSNADVIQAVAMMGGLNGAPPQAKIVRKDPT